MPRNRLITFAAAAVVFTVLAAGAVVWTDPGGGSALDAAVLLLLGAIVGGLIGIILTTGISPIESEPLSTQFAQAVRDILELTPGVTEWIEAVRRARSVLAGPEELAIAALRPALPSGTRKRDLRTERIILIGLLDRMLSDPALLHCCGGGTADDLRRMLASMDSRLGMRMFSSRGAPRLSRGAGPEEIECA